MYQLESGREDFLGLLRQLPKALGEDKAKKVTAVGLVLAPVNGALNVCVNFDDTPDHLSEMNSSDFDLPHVLEFGEEVAPLKNWTDQYWNEGKIVLKNGTILEDWVADASFAEPIMEEVCKWVDEFYRSDTFSGILPIWIVVDEIDSGSNRFWRLGKLEEGMS